MLGQTEGDTSLHHSVRKGNIFKTKEILKENPDFVRTENIFGETPLHLACKNKNNALIDILVKHGSDIYKTTKDCQYPIELYTGRNARNYPQILESLIKQENVTEIKTLCLLGARINDNDIRTAVKMLSLPLVKVLYRSGEPVPDLYDLLSDKKRESENVSVKKQEIRDYFNRYSMQSLQTYIDTNDLDSVSNWLDNAPCGLQTDIDTRELVLYGSAPRLCENAIISYAKEKKAIQAICLVIRKYPEIVNLKSGERRETLLHWAAGQGYIDVIQEALKHSVFKPNVYSELDGFTALHRATFANQVEIARLLILYRFDVNAQSRFYESTPLHFAAGKGSAEMVQLLLENGAELKKDNKGKTPLDIARERIKIMGDPVPYQKVIELFYRHRDLETYPTLLHLAAEFGYCDLIEEEVQKSPLDLEKQNYGRRTPLLQAIRYRQFDAVKRLVQLGANVNAQDIELKTPLHHLVRGDSLYLSAKNVLLEMTNFLVQNNARLMLDVYGKSQLYCAKLNKKYNYEPEYLDIQNKIIELLEKLPPVQLEDLAKRFDRSLSIYSARAEHKEKAAVCPAFTMHRRTKSCSSFDNLEIEKLPSESQKKGIGKSESKH